MDFECFINRPDPLPSLSAKHGQPYTAARWARMHHHPAFAHHVAVCSTGRRLCWTLPHAWPWGEPTDSMARHNQLWSYVLQLKRGPSARPSPLFRHRRAPVRFQRHGHRFQACYSVRATQVVRHVYAKPPPINLDRNATKTASVIRRSARARRSQARGIGINCSL